MKRREAQALLVISDFLKTPVPDAVSFAKSALLELGARSIQRLVAVVLAPSNAFKLIRPRKDLVNMLSIVCPVGSNVERATRDEAVCDQVDKIRLHNSSLVVSFLRPGIGKVQVHAGQRLPGDLLFKHVDSVMDNQSQILEVLVFGLQQAVAHPRFMNLNSQEIHGRILRGLFDERNAIAKAYFQGDRLFAPEYVAGVEGFGFERQAKCWQQLIQRPLLRRCEPTVAPHKAPDGAAVGVVLADLHRRKYYLVPDRVQAKASVVAGAGEHTTVCLQAS